MFIKPEPLANHVSTDIEFILMCKNNEELPVDYSGIFRKIRS